jgi:dTDP-4-dehydrorhamnose 3,5-epimerase
MNIERCHIEGLLLIKPDIYEDERGYFFESFNQQRFASLTGISSSFVQDNESRSQKNVLRGMHFQNPPHAQAKLVRVVSGAVLDVAVDLRKQSPSFGSAYSVILSAENKHQFFIPEGFAHGFLVLEDNTVFSYKCTAYYNKQSEQCLRWNDPDMNIDWGIKNPVLSEKDEKYALFWSEFKSQFQH